MWPSYGDPFPVIGRIGSKPYSAVREGEVLSKLLFMTQPRHLLGLLLLLVLSAGFLGCQNKNDPAAADAPPARAAAYRVYIGTFTGHGSKGVYAMTFANGTLSQPELVAEAQSP